MSESFKTRFYKDYNEIVQSLNALDGKLDADANEAERKRQFACEYEKISARVDVLQRYFGEYTATLPTFEVRKAQEHLGKLNRLAQEKRESIMPKKKFGFKSKQNVTTLEHKIETDEAAAAVSAAVKLTTEKNSSDLKNSNINVESSICLKGLRDQYVVKLNDEIGGKDVAIVDVKNSTICLQGSPSVLHIESIDSCTILCGPVVGSSFINKCTNSRLVLASHQLRIHETTQTQFYIHVGSRAIIENTREISFAPYAWSFPSLDKLFASTHLFSLTNNNGREFNYTAIDDFNWLNQAQKSPNWRFLEEAEQDKWTTDEHGQIII